MGGSNVVNLRPIPTRPYDREVDDGAPVVLSELEWSVVVSILARSGALAAEDLSTRIRTQIRAHQARRLHPATRGGRYA